MEPIAPSSSKVTVEYFDPSGVFPLISPTLHARLPLRNLHWKSPTRPLRSIDALHIDLIPHSSTPEQRTTSTETPNVHELGSRPSSRGSVGAEAKASVIGGSAGTHHNPRGRRHQIPGLRQTPYLKIYFLRCDDNETYKASSRKLVREWIKEHASSGSQGGSSHENHDAFEWLIVHVVLPNTPAASQPATSGPYQGGSSEKNASTSRWPGRGSSTLIEKIRADFGTSSRTAPDHIAQIRVPISTLSSPSGGEASLPSSGPSVDDAEELERSWSDMLAKMKELILSSFDLRVAQYEEDIRERDAQRSLPGWNFCTFFILKEGLARGFESVGLIEDALVLYDELEAGLETIVREHSMAEIEHSHGGTFPRFTPDLLQYALDTFAEVESFLRQSAQQGASGSEKLDSATPERTPGVVEDPGLLPLDARRKNYRELILSNNISVFDFRCYLLARQMSLLYRLGNPVPASKDAILRVHALLRGEVEDVLSHHISPASTGSETQDKRGNLLALAEMCRRISESITSIARIMQADIKSGLSTQEAKGISMDPGVIDVLTEHIVSSWMYSVTQQILGETASTSLPILPSTSVINAAPPLDARARPHPGHSAVVHPTRTSSLLSRSTSTSEWPSMQPSYPDAPEEARSQQAQSNPRKTGLEELSNARAQIYILDREILERLAHAKRWYSERTKVATDLCEDQFAHVNLDDQQVPQVPTRAQAAGDRGLDIATFGITNVVLKSALTNLDNFYHLYTKLTEEALSHYAVANKLKSVEKAVADMAVLKYQVKDLTTAAAYFRRLAPFYAEDGWNMVETAMLKMYARSLKELDRRDDFINVMLKLLAKAAWKRKIDSASKIPSSIVSDLASLPSWVNDDFMDTSDLFNEVVCYSDRLDHQITVPADKYFGLIQVEPQLFHFSDKDGFQVQLQIRYLFDEQIELAPLKLRLMGTDQINGREIWLESDQSVVLSRGLVKVILSTHVSAPGAYMMDKLLLRSHNITFVHETLLPKNGTGGRSQISPPAGAAIAASKLTYYPPLRSLEASIAVSRTIRLDQPRSIEVTIRSGWNDIISAELRLKAASAGLRLRVAEAEVIGDAAAITMDTAPSGHLRLQHIPEDTTVKLRVPYGLEHDLNELIIKLELAYDTQNGSFVYGVTSTVAIALPLGVNVQETFKKDALFSKFTVSTSTLTPLQISSSNLESSQLLEAQTGDWVLSRTMVLPKQPLTLVYQIRQKNSVRDSSEHNLKELATLQLQIDYSCLDEMIAAVVEKRFLDALQETQFYTFKSLLLPALRSSLADFLTPTMMESIAILGSISIPALCTLKWEDTFRCIPRKLHEELQLWLSAWHKSNNLIPLFQEGYEHLFDGLQRRIIIPVEIPSITVVLQAQLRLHLAGLEGVPSYHTAAVGEAIPAELSIQYTRAWDLFLKDASLDLTAALEFVYEVHAHTDAWLLGGPRRGHLMIKENDVYSVQLLLIPVRPGNILLPGIDIRLATASTQDRDRNILSPNPGSQYSPQPAAVPQQDSSITCEIDYRNQSETVLVLPGVVSTTLKVDANTPSHGAAVIDASLIADAQY